MILQKLEKFLFYLFLFLIPLQLRMTIWGPPAGGEWNSIFLYLTDLLLVGVFVLAIINTKPKGLRFKKSNLFLILFFLVAALSLINSINLGNSIYRLLKLSEFLLLYIYIMYKKKFLGLNNIFKVIFASGVFQAFLAIIQFYKQGSLGLKFTEAGIYAPGAPGVATFLMGEEKIMRPYGSFPHPNVLSGFLLLAIFCFYCLWLSNSIKGRLSYVFYALCCTTMVFALFLTASRGTILVFLFVSFGFLLVRFFQLRGFYLSEERLVTGKKTMILASIFVFSCLISIIIAAPYLKARFYTISLKEQAIDLRFFYNKMAVSTIKEKPLLGVGIGNFVDWSHKYQVYSRAAVKMLESVGEKIEQIPEWIYQPVHNIYLLAVAEVGIFGALFFLIFLLIKPVKQMWPIKPKDLASLIGPMPFLFVGFLVLGLNDHYFWTLQSGGIMFWLALALISERQISNSKIQIIPNQAQNLNV